jgi:hypothetical protein
MSQTTTISATATVRVRGMNSPAAANAVASMLGEALGTALRSATLGPINDREAANPRRGGER